MMIIPCIVIGGTSMKFKVTRNIIAIALCVTLVILFLSAIYVGFGTSYGYLFETDTLNLTVEGRPDDYVNIDVINMNPGKQIRGSYTIENTGILEGYLNLFNIKVKNYENRVTALETKAGDNTDSVGELGDLINVRIFTDVDSDGWVDKEDTIFYNGKMGALQSNLKLNAKIVPSSKVKIGVIFDWQDTNNCNKATGDTTELDFRFDLSQKATN